VAVAAAQCGRDRVGPLALGGKDSLRVTPWKGERTGHLDKAELAANVKYGPRSNPSSVSFFAGEFFFPFLNV
jgi:hypothetical protein